jgi:hypothetical protein
MFGVRGGRPHASEFVGVLIIHCVQVAARGGRANRVQDQPFSRWLTWRLLTGVAEQSLERCAAEAGASARHPEGSLGMEGAARAARPLARVSWLAALSLLLVPKLLSSFVLVQPF